MRVVAHLGASIVTVDGLLHLDGLLGYAAFRRYPDRASLPPPDTMEDPIDFDLPLARWEHAGHWGWCASSIEADWVAEETRYLSKPTPSARMARYSSAPSVNVGAGPHKAWRLPFPARLAEEARWYALGDVARVREMLGSISHLGKLHHHGAGEVLAWTVELWGEDWSCVRDGLPTRHLPVGFPGVVGEPPTISGGIRPPYWHAARRATVYMPAQAQRRAS